MTETDTTTQEPPERAADAAPVERLGELATRLEARRADLGQRIRGERARAAAAEGERWRERCSADRRLDAPPDRALLDPPRPAQAATGARQG